MAKPEIRINGEDRSSKGWLCIILVGVLMLPGMVRGQQRREIPMEMIDAALNPFWRSTTMAGDSLFFYQREAGQPASARLLFVPEKILSVGSATRETTYEEGRDFVVDRSAGVLTLTKDSRIPFRTLEEMYPPIESKLPKIAHKRGDPKTGLIFSEGRFFHDLQVEVSYTHAAGEWKGPVPAFAGKQLPCTLAKLRAKEPLTICVSGDSISAGGNASREIGAPPFMPAFPELVARGVEKAYGAKVTLRNFAVGGWTTEQGLKDVQRVIDGQPDLVIIHYGLNDCGGIPTGRYLANVQAIMDRVREKSPQAEFILVSVMLGNEEWHLLDLKKLLSYREGLLKLAGNGVAVANVTAMWEELLKRKSFHDLTGNGVNHPNDFGHRIYAQTILAMLVAESR